MRWNAVPIIQIHKSSSYKDTTFCNTLSDAVSDIDKYVPEVMELKMALKM